MSKNMLEQKERGDLNLICLFRDLRRTEGLSAKDYISRLSQRDRRRLRLALRSDSLPWAMEELRGALQAALGAFDEVR